MTHLTNSLFHIHIIIFFCKHVILVVLCIPQNAERLGQWQFSRSPSSKQVQILANRRVRERLSVSLDLNVWWSSFLNAMKTTVNRSEAKLNIWAKDFQSRHISGAASEAFASALEHRGCCSGDALCFSILRMPKRETLTSSSDKFTRTEYSTGRVWDAASVGTKGQNQEKMLFSPQIQAALWGHDVRERLQWGLPSFRERMIWLNCNSMSPQMCPCTGMMPQIVARKCK